MPDVFFANTFRSSGEYLMKKCAMKRLLVEQEYIIQPHNKHVTLVLIFYIEKEGQDYKMQLSSHAQVG